MDATLSIQGLKLATTIGAYEWEKKITQVVLIDLELQLNIASAAEHDDLSHALDYAHLAQVLQKEIQSQHYQLIETLAVFLHKQITKHYPHVIAGKLTIHKPGALVNAKNVAIEISWTSALENSI